MKINSFKQLLMTAILAASITALQATVYIPGFIQAQLSGSANNTDDILTAEQTTYTAGAVMGNTSGSAQDLYGNNWSWGDNRSFGYLGQIYLDADTTYTFMKSIDDWTYIKIGETVVIDNGTYNNLTSGSFTSTTAGWYDIEVRMGNGGGGAGLANGAKYGIAYNTVGDTSQANFKAMTDGWVALLDPGDATHLRYAISEENYLTIDSVAPNGDNLDVTFSVSNISEAGATVTLFWGAGDGETVPDNWDNTMDIAISATGTQTVSITGGANAAFFTARMISSPWLQWTSTFSLAEESPSFTLLPSVVDYTYAEFSATVTGTGVGAASVAAELQISTQENFSSILASYDLSLTGIGNQTIVADNLVTNTVYYARIFGENNLGETGYSSVIGPITTLEPTQTEGAIAIESYGFTEIGVFATTTDFGDDSDYASVRLEASTTADFANLAAVSEVVNVTTLDTITMDVENLDPATTYYLRLRYINEWGIVSYVVCDVTQQTRAVPIATTGLSYTTGDTVDVTFGITQVYDGATGSVALYYGNASDPSTLISSQDFASAGTLTWSGLQAYKTTAYAKAVVTSVVGGVEYTTSYMIPIAPGSTLTSVSNVADFASAETALIINVGDAISLPEALGNYSYRIMNKTFAELDGAFVTAIAPGILGIQLLNGDVVEQTMAVIILPEPIADGNIYIFKEYSSSKNTWDNPETWIKVGSETNDSWPCQVNDIAIIPYYDSVDNTYLRTSSDLVLGGMYVGKYTDRNIRVVVERQKTSEHRTLTFNRTDGEQAFVQVCPNTRDGRECAIQLGGYPLDIYYEVDTYYDSGWYIPDWEAEMTRGKYDLVNATNNIPAGVTMTFRNSNPRGTSMGETFSEGHFVGEGVVWNRSQGNIAYWSDLSRFSGILRDSSHGNANYDRSGPTFIRTGSASNVLAEAIGFVPCGSNPNIGTSGAGLIVTGWEPGYNSDSAHPDDHWFTGRGLRLVGGEYYARATENTSWGYGVAETKIGETLIIGSGMSHIYETDRNQQSNHPINYLQFNSLIQEDKGTLCFYEPSRRYNPEGVVYTNNYTVIKGHEEHLIGGTASPRVSDDYPIIPWIVSPASTSGGSWETLLFMCFEPGTDRIIRPVYNNTSIDGAASNQSNAYTWDKNATIAEDVTVNSLFLNNSSKGKTLGADRTLTITSGGLVLHGSSSGFGVEGGVENGALVLGSAQHPAYVFARSSDASQPNVLWSPVTAPGGFVAGYCGYLQLGGDQTGIADEIVINAGTLILGSATTPCAINPNMEVRLVAGANLSIPIAGALNTSTLRLDGHAGYYGKVNIAEGVEEKVGRIYVRDYPDESEWTSLPRGTYGSSESNAEFVDDTLFSGKGVLKVMSDDVLEPTLILMF